MITPELNNMTKNQIRAADSMFNTYKITNNFLCQLLTLILLSTGEIIQ